jgi:hypothetical protein
MTKIEELEQKLNECQKALAELKESKKEGKWKPEINEQYWIKTDEGEFDWFRWYGDNEDNWRYKNLPIFPTKEECERYWHFMDAVKEKNYSFSKEEWGKHNIRKYTIYYDFNRKEFGVDRSIDIKYLGEIYFKTEEDCQYIIDNFKDELMEYWI